MTAASSHEAGVVTHPHGQSGARSYVRFGSDGLVYTMCTSSTSGSGADWSGCAR